LSVFKEPVRNPATQKIVSSSWFPASETSTCKNVIKTQEFAKDQGLGSKRRIETTAGPNARLTAIASDSYIYIKGHSNDHF
jgi:hypothetical protein